MSRCLILAAALVVASCATTGGYESSLKPWAGAQEADLLRAWGTPARSYEANGRKFIVFEAQREIHLPDSSDEGQAGGSIGMDVGLSCTTTFELENSKVVSWSYKGDDCTPRR